jgi:hypothetical protein
VRAQARRPLQDLGLEDRVCRWRRFVRTGQIRHLPPSNILYAMITSEEQMLINIGLGKVDLLEA